MKHFHTDDLVVSANQEESALHDAHVTAYKRYHGIHDAHVACRARFKASLHDSHVTKYFEHLAKINKPSHYRHSNDEGLIATILCGVER